MSEKKGFLGGLFQKEKKGGCCNMEIVEETEMDTSCCAEDPDCYKDDPDCCKDDPDCCKDKTDCCGQGK